MKTLILNFLAVLGCCTAFTHTNAHEAPNGFEKWRNSVVQILITCKEGELPHSASGIVVSSSGHVLTAAHTGNACLNMTKAQVNTIVDLYGPTKNAATATIVSRSADGITSPSKLQSSNTEWQDVALWQIDGFENLDLDLQPVVIAGRVPALGSDLSIIGFPGLPFGFFRQADSNGQPLDTEPPYIGVGVSVFQTYLMSASAHPTKDPYRLQYDGGTLAGLSGAAILNHAGELVGLHSGRSVQFVTDLVDTNCLVPDSLGICSDIPDFTETYRKTNGDSDKRQVESLGISVTAFKNVLENYSWGTSVWGIPPEFFAEIRVTESNVEANTQQQPMVRFCAEGETPVMVDPQQQRAQSSPTLVPSCRRRQGS